MKVNEITAKCSNKVMFTKTKKKGTRKHTNVRIGLYIRKVVDRMNFLLCNAWISWLCHFESVYSLFVNCLLTWNGQCHQFQLNLTVNHRLSIRCTSTDLTMASFLIDIRFGNWKTDSCAYSIRQWVEIFNSPSLFIAALCVCVWIFTIEIYHLTIPMACHFSDVSCTISHSFQNP